MALGRAASLRPLCRDFGFSRGTPIDRYYIERFLADNATYVRGHALEVKDGSYTLRFGGDQVTGLDVLDLDEGNPAATIIGDISKADVLPRAAFDCIILTQTLQFVFDLPAAIQQVRRALRPGGTALITVPGISAIEQPALDYDWCWSLTPAALRKLLVGPFVDDKVEVAAFGNLFSATAFLHGAAVQEVKKSKLDRFDPAYPVIAAARCTA